MEKIGRERLNKPLLASTVAAIAMSATAAAGIAILKKPKKKPAPQQRQIQIYKLAELEEVKAPPPPKPPPSPKPKPQTITYTLWGNFIPKSSDLPMCKSISTTATHTTKNITITRIIAGIFRNKTNAERLKEVIKRTNPHLDPWIMKKGRLYQVVAGSYSDPQNIKETIQTLKKLRINPVTQKITIKKTLKIYRITCILSPDQREALIKRAKKLGLTPNPQSL